MITTNWKARTGCPNGRRSAGDRQGYSVVVADRPDARHRRPDGHHFGFEIISEQDDGFIIVASADESLAYFQQKAQRFYRDLGRADQRAPPGIAKIHELREDLTQEERLRRILTERLFSELPQLDTDAPYFVDVSISCQGNWILPRNRNGVAVPTRHGPKKKPSGHKPATKPTSNGTG